MMADLLVWLFLKTMFGSSLQQLYVQADLSDATWPNAKQQVVPPPLLENNFISATHRCLYGKSIESVISSSSGWVYEVEGAEHDKPGWVSRNLGDTLQITLDTRVQLDPTDAADNPPLDSNTLNEKINPPADLAIGFLQSYEHMGSAKVTCEGCSCSCTSLKACTESEGTGSFLKALIDERVSQRRLAHFSITRASNCVVTITNEKNPALPTQEHKFKLEMLSLAETRFGREDYIDYKGTLAFPSG